MKPRYKSKNNHNQLIICIVVGIVITIGGMYWYENTPKIIKAVGQISDTASNTISQSISNYANPESSNIDTQSIALQIHNLINQQRANAGMVALSWDNSLAIVAAEHSDDMIKNNYFDHVDLQGHDPAYRIQQVDNSCLDASENIAWAKGYNMDQVAEATVNWWMSSFEHRANILKQSFTSEGIGVSINGSYAIATEDFC